MSFRSVDARFWTDPAVRKLDLETKMIFLYLITCPNSHYTGVFYCPLPTMMYEVNFSEETLRRGLQALSEQKMVMFEEESSTVFVVNAAKFQIKAPKSTDNQIKGIDKYFTENIQSPYILDLFRQKYPLVSELSGYNFKPLASPLQAPCDTLVSPSGIDTVIQTAIGTVKETDINMSSDDPQTLKKDESEIHKPKKREPIDYSFVLSEYNRIMTPVCKGKKDLDDDDKKKIRDTYEDIILEYQTIEAYFQRCLSEPFIKGELLSDQHTTWRPTLEYFFRRKTLKQMKEDSYPKPRAQGALPFTQANSSADKMAFLQNYDKEAANGG